MQHATTPAPRTRISCTTRRFNLYEKTPKRREVGSTTSNPNPRTNAFKTRHCHDCHDTLDTIDTEVPEAHDDSIHPLALYCGVPLIPAGASHVANAIVHSSEPSGLYHFPSAKPNSKPPTSPTSPSPSSLQTLEKRVSENKNPNSTLHEQLLQEKPNCIAKALYDFLNSSSLLAPRRAALLPCAHPTNRHQNPTYISLGPLVPTISTTVPIRP